MGLFPGSFPQATAFPQSLSSKRSQHPGYALGRDPGLCVGLWSGRSSVLRPPFFLFPGGGRQLLFLRSLFPVPCAFSRLSLHLPPTLPQIYSSTLGELGRHPASPIGLLSNWCTHRARAGWRGGTEGGKWSLSALEARDWVRITSCYIPAPTPVLWGS